MGNQLQVYGYDRLLYCMGAPDQNAHCGHAADPAKRGHPTHPKADKRPLSYRAVCGDGADLSAAHVFKEYDLDNIVKSAVKKFSSEFIGRKLRLIYDPLNTSVITDEKWLSFVIEQVLSNALKYTPSGSITISLVGEKTLRIEDTGIGIAPSDLPRTFENGYTGFNGRTDKTASGIGLYLCRRVCNNLGHTITANSTVDVGTAIDIDLTQTKLEME